MSTGPNRTVAAARRRKWVKVAEVAGLRMEHVDANAHRLQLMHPGAHIRRSSYRTGPRTAPLMRYVVRAYLPA